MKKGFLSLLLTAILVISAIPVFAVSDGIGIGIDITPEEFAPRIWMCDDRVVLDDAVEGGRDTNDGEEMFERVNNYAFEGEQIHWTVLVMDKNKIEEIQEVVVTIGSPQGVGNDIEVECARTDFSDIVEPECNARILEEDLTGERIDPATQQYYDCTFTVETPDSMYDEYFITVEAISVDGSATIDENEFWFLNPIIAVSVDGDVTFEEVRPGSVSYSETILVGNDADEGSGVMLDMFISGTDFYDPDPSGAKCPVSNRLKLGDNFAEGISGPGGESIFGEAIPGFLDDRCEISLDGDEVGDHLCYYATQGAYSTEDDVRNDAEGYVPIVYGDTFTRDFYNDAEIIGTPSLISLGGVDYYAGNVLTPGAEIALNFKLGLPEPCVGNFNTGDIFFWGEAI
ncbi:hypothetical protein HYV88_06095 [Candidatus Woesearchaeota archaeon]|nr:hypothetical protein [Candidatus Woesearchaeota archaeon]